MSSLPLRYRPAWIAAIWLLVLVIVVGSLIPNTGLPSVAGSDKVEHIVAYFALSVLGAAVVARDGLIRVMARSLALGVALEVAQGLLTDTRTADWADVLADATGILAAWCLVRHRAGWAQAVEAWLAGRRQH